MTEWLKVRAWKVRIPQKGIVGSNPAFSANGVRNLGVNKQEELIFSSSCLFMGLMCLQILYPPTLLNGSGRSFSD